MPDHLAALQHIRTRDFRFGERSQAIVRALRLDEIAEISRLAAQKRVTSAAQSIIIMIAS
ncbi:hypothetical protein ACNJYD_33040 [Bradyrhizobium sp. DASA03005]|uniref:hypothetical protein n=1 Tax=Bradyrhizobium TaxID=374 RepID=UPI001BA4C15E|nr:hypothetical protein [Bradyrhizobium liaoningense]MBR1171060.1 hypothetical protein [Bradyrhizobium liaoningense]